MDVDINQLPIPPWNLTCPNCSYCLNGLTSHRCPECGTEFDMASIVLPHVKVRPPKYTGHESPMADFGIDCNACHKPLVGAINATCPHCQTPFSRKAFLPKRDWFRVEHWMHRGIPMEIVALILHDAFVPYIHMKGHNAFTIGAVQITVATEFFFDALYLMRKRAKDANSH